MRWILMWCIIGAIIQLIDAGLNWDKTKKALDSIIAEHSDWLSWGMIDKILVFGIVFALSVILWPISLTLLLFPSLHSADVRRHFDQDRHD